MARSSARCVRGARLPRNAALTGRCPGLDVLVDLGFDDAQELSAKAILAVKLNKLIDAHALNQVQAAQILGMPQPKISAIRNYKLQGISLERLMHALTALGQQVKIVVMPSRRGAPAGIKVAA
jgi:predicted XRE-type DNA-binding protein